MRAAAEKAREEAEQEAEEGMNDLLVCLGQEEAKVEALRNKLEAMGVDVEAVLSEIQGAEAGDE